MDEHAQTREHLYAQPTQEHQNQEHFVHDMMLLNRQTEIKTDLFLEAHWAGTGKAGIQVILDGEYPKNKSAYFIVAYSPNNDEQSNQFEFFSQTVEADSLESVVYPDFSKIKKLKDCPKPLYIYYKLKNGHFTKIKTPKRISEEQKSAAA